MSSNPPTGHPSDETPFALHQVIDRQHQGLVASVFEYPAGWQARSDIAWNFQNVSFPMLSYAQVRHPQGVERLEFWPTEAFCWIEPSAYGFYQQGQNVLGQTVMPPMSAADAMTRWVVPRWRGNSHGLRIVGVSLIPQLAQILNADLKGLPGEGAGVRIEYAEQGTLLEEEFYGIQVAQNVPYYGPMGAMTQINWFLTRVFSFRAEKGQVDSRREMFWRIARSVKLNPQWERLYAQIMQQLQAQFDQYIAMGYSQIQAAGQMSRAISANNDAWLNAFEQQRQAAWHSSHSSSGSSSESRSPNEAFSEYIRGVETYDDPYYGESQQDYNYQYHWTDGFGNYQHSNDPFFNPNLDSNQNWTLMEPKKQ